MQATSVRRSVAQIQGCFSPSARMAQWQYPLAGGAGQPASSTMFDTAHSYSHFICVSLKSDLAAFAPYMH